jgi:hypothetical protein
MFTYLQIVTIGGIVVSVLAIGPKVRGSNPGREQWILRAMEVRRMTSFGEVKPFVPSNGLRHVKES